ncbi:Exostosin-like protein [Rhynchospora pubera]|uniref:Exostosin-like protein n=1 Tax=Rhynchospora pubera TaxID=906938 RepID=A0AAV8D0N7_9POAL|nr:Exostosin-like protein [Rhynchospora pubera]
MSPLNLKSKKLLFFVISIAILVLVVSCWSLKSGDDCTFSNPSLLFPTTNNTSEYIADYSYRVRPTTKVRKISIKECNITEALLKVYIYDLPPMFHFGMLGWKGKANQTWPDVSEPNQVPKYPGGLNLQHSIEYWLILDLLSSTIPGFKRPCTAIRVEDPNLADIFFVPFFSSLSYNRHSKIHGKEKISKNKFLQEELVRFLMNREEWRKGGGRDHFVPAHHPNSMLDARKSLGSAMLLLADFGRYPLEIANLKKDVIAPYRHVVDSVGDKSPSFEERPILAYFQGAIYRKDGGMIRQKLYRLLKDEKDIHFTYGTVRQNGVKNASKGMANSKFCLNIAGDTPSSNRLFDAIVSHCVPVIISDEIELPYEDVLDYSEFCVFVRGTDALRDRFLVRVLRGIGREEWERMWQRLREVARHFEYSFPSIEGDAVDMIWGAVHRKISAIRLDIHRRSRYNGLEKSGSEG